MDNVTYTSDLVAEMTFSELGLALADHVRNCDKDHSQTTRQVPLVQFNAMLDTLTCGKCGEQEDIKVSHKLDGPIEIYFCRLLQQQQAFFDNHFASCLVPEGDAS